MKQLWRQRWAFVPVVLLGSTIVFAFVTVRLALRDHGTAAEPDSYRKALAWDDERARRKAGESLGWTVSPSLTRPSASELEVELVIADKHGHPIDGAEISIEAIPIRAADAAVTRRAQETAAGRYLARMPARIGGQWEFRVELRRGEQRLAESFRRSIAPPRPEHARTAPAAASVGGGAARDARSTADGWTSPIPPARSGAHSPSGSEAPPP